MATKTNAQKPKNIGIDVAAPEKSGASYDKKDPFFGDIKVRGRKFVGTVVSDKMQKTATVMWTRYRSLPKFERFEQVTTKVHAHNPESINAKKGDKVVIVETRPLSKTKNFVIVEKLGKDIAFHLKEQTVKDDEEFNISEKKRRQLDAKEQKQKETAESHESHSKQGKKQKFSVVEDVDSEDADASQDSEEFSAEEGNN